MTFELMGDMLNNSSPLYLYVGFIWSMVEALQLINMNMDRFRKHHHFCVRKTYTFQVETALIQEPAVINMDFKTWMSHKMKQMQSPDDDSDEDSFSIFKTQNEIRGGKNCVINLYSRSLKNIA